MKKNLIIVGAGGLGRIVYDVISKNIKFTNIYNIIGFLDTRPDLILPDDIDLPLLGNPLEYTIDPNDVFLVAVGSPEWREALVFPLLKQGAVFISYSNESSVGARTLIGQGSFLTPGSVVSVDCTVGEFGYLDTYIVLGHDVKIGKHCMVGAMSFIAGGVRVGDRVTIQPRATIAKDVSIGDDAVIGIGSVVVNDVPAGVTVFGNPARIIFKK